MYFLYSILLTAGALIMLPLFVVRRRKYASGLGQRLGNYPVFENDARPVIWLHCVSVGEANAARPLVDEIRSQFPSHRLIISTTTRTGQDLARKIFSEKADAVFYFPFDWKFSVRRALQHFKPSLVLLMETEIWPRFIREAHLAGAKLAVVNGRLSERSSARYSFLAGFIQKVLSMLDLVLVQDAKSAERFARLGLDPDKIIITGNLKFDLSATREESELTGIFRERFAIDSGKKLIVAASTHEPEERLILDALESDIGGDFRLLIAPRHPERFDDVARLLEDSSNAFVRRSSDPGENDRTTDVILLDSIGELRAVYPLADIVFVGGSLIPHGGQNILEPGAFGKAIITGPYTANFETSVSEFLACDALVQTPAQAKEYETVESLSQAFEMLLDNDEKRRELGENAAAIMGRSNREATIRTVDELRRLLEVRK